MSLLQRGPMIPSLILCPRSPTHKKQWYRRSPTAHSLYILHQSMSGAGRRSGYRKSVTTSYENDYPLPSQEKQEYIGKVRGNRGTNIFEFELANGSVELARMPNKFKKVIWVKRNEYIIIQSLMATSTTTVFTAAIEVTIMEHSDTTIAADDEAKVKYEIIHILNKQQIKHIQVIKHLFHLNFISNMSILVF